MEPFIGEVRLLSFDYPPQGWAVCNGAVLNIHDYTALFALIGSYFGGDGVTTFALPNLQGRVIIGFGEGPGLEQYTIGETGGATTVTLNADQYGTHSHSMPVGTRGEAGKVPGPGVWISPIPGDERTPGAPIYASDLSAGGTGMNEAMVKPAGGGGAHNNMAPYMVMTYCMALQGIVPQRN